MRIEPSFRPVRIYLMLRNTIVLNRFSLMFAGAAVAGTLLFISLLDALGPCRPRLHQHLYLAVLFLGGLLLTSRSFKGLHDPVDSLPWLLLPASMLEKALARILLTTFVYVAGSMVFYILFSIVSEGLNYLVVKRHHLLFNPFDPMVLRGALSYMAIQAPFLLGAVYFRKHALSKTILSILAFSLIFGLGVLVAGRIILGDQLAGLVSETHTPSAEFNVAWMQLAKFGRTAAGAAKTVFWFVIPVVCWTTCYFRLKETER